MSFQPAYGARTHSASCRPREAQPHHYRRWGEPLRQDVSAVPSHERACAPASRVSSCCTSPLMTTSWESSTSSRRRGCSTPTTRSSALAAPPSGRGRYERRRRANGSGVEAVPGSMTARRTGGALRFRLARPLSGIAMDFSGFFPNMSVRLLPARKRGRSEPVLGITRFLGSVSGGVFEACVFSVARRFGSSGLHFS